MEKLINDISDIVIPEINIINEKVKGINFLELLKFNLIEKLTPLILKQKFPLEQKIDFQKDINDNSRNIKISINYYISPLSISKKNIDNNSLFLVFNDASNIDIYVNEKKFTNILLFKNSGISVPKDTLINSKFNKNVLLLKIIDKNSE